jgi:hypothetical protein
MWKIGIVARTKLLTTKIAKEKPPRTLRRAIQPPFKLGSFRLYYGLLASVFCEYGVAGDDAFELTGIGAIDYRD